MADKTVSQDVMDTINTYDVPVLKEEADRLEEEARIIRAIIAASKGAKTKKARGNGNGHTKPIEAKRVFGNRIRHAKKVLAKPTKQRQLHGKYLGLTRTLPKEQKAKLSELYKSKGVRAALAEAKRMRASA